MGAPRLSAGKGNCFQFCRRVVRLSLLTALLAGLPVPQLIADPVDKVGPQERCQVCGMFVAKYPVWITQIVMEDGKIRFFDGVKDLMVFYRTPDTYGARQDQLTEVWVKDYYSLEWIDGRKAFYVVGSDVYGPMGHEFIPFATREAAADFKKDHKGTRVVSFEEITIPLLDSMRQGQK